MSELLFWQANFSYPASSYILDGSGNIQFTTTGGISGARPPAWTTTTTTDNTITWDFVGFGGKATELQRVVNNIGPYLEFLTDAVSYSRGSADAGKFVLLNADGSIDPTLIYTPPVITSFTNNINTVEIGSSVASVTLNWTLNKTVTSQTLTGVGSISPSLRTWTFTGPFTSNQSWTLTVGDGVNSANATTSILFENKRYWGVSPLTSLTTAEILALGGSEFATNFDKTVVYNCSVGSGFNYPYYAYPASFGLPTNVTVGGLSFSAWNYAEQSFTNASGYTSEYYVLSFDNIQTGASINVVWQ